jgi:hypothetical protein
MQQQQQEQQYISVLTRRLRQAAIAAAHGRVCLTLFLCCCQLKMLDLLFKEHATTDLSSLTIG